MSTEGLLHSDTPNAAPPKLSFVMRHLDPADSLSEVLFGVIMALTFTLGAGLIVKEGPDATTKLLLGVLGCNIAWGIVDGAMYVMDSLLERSRKASLLLSIQKAAGEEEALAMVGRSLDARLEPFTSQAERRHLYQAVLERLKNVAPERTRVKKEDVYGGIASFWLMFLTTVPAVVPFLVFSDRFTALRMSNLLLLSMLFLAGYGYARATHSNPWVLGSALLLAGLVLVAIVIAFGG